MGPSRAMGHVLPRQVIHRSMGSWHAVAERKGKQGSPSSSKLNLESVHGMGRWQTCLTVAPPPGACHSRARKKKNYKKGVQFWTRFWGQKWVPKVGPKFEPPGTCLIHFPYASA